VVELEQHVLESGGPPPPADAFTINGQPGPNYNCSSKGNKYQMKNDMINLQRENRSLILVYYIFVFQMFMRFR